VIALDTYALVAVAVGERASGEVSELLRTDECVMTTASVAELCDQLVRRVGLDPELVTERVEALLDGPIGVRALDRERATLAGLLRARHYEPRKAELSLADCILLASLGKDDRLATSDPPLAQVARRLGFRVVALPDTRGRRP
jgi:PIN domain nuclease of toxin-antitoxin system